MHAGHACIRGATRLAAIHGIVDAQCFRPCRPADPFSESEAPKKWVQPSGGRKQWTITSDGLR